MDGSRAPFSVGTASWPISILSLSDTQKRSWDDLAQVAQGRPESLMRAGGTGNCRSGAWHVNQCKGGQLVAGRCLSSDPWRWTLSLQPWEQQQDFSLRNSFQFPMLTLN